MQFPRQTPLSILYFHELCVVHRHSLINLDRIGCHTNPIYVLCLPYDPKLVLR